MAAKVSLSTLEEEERRARRRLAAFRARLYRHDAASPIAVERRLRELERSWQGASKRLRKARRGEH
jgi:hypothetical protein